MSDPTREAGHAPMPPDGGDLRITYRASEVIALGNRRFDEGWDAAISTTPAPLDAALERLDEDDIDYRTNPAGPTALEPNEPELWVRYAALAREYNAGRTRRMLWEHPMSDPTREAIIEGLARASDWIKPEPGMDGPHGGHIGGVTRQRAVAAIEAALEYLAALSTTPAPLDEAHAKVLALGCIRMHWGAARPCDEYDDGRDHCGPCALRVAPEGAPHE